jgi:uncharacterized protein (TIGR02453 family)
MVQQFEGFSAEGLKFLVDVRQHNSKEWFDEHRSIYEQHLLNPMRTLIEQLSQRMLLIDESFEIRPAIGKTISRLNRDTRFSHSKLRYRSSMWFTFKRISKDWKDAPVYFFEITPHAYRYGLGYYSASRQTMDLFRRLIDSDRKRFLKVIKCCKPPFELDGECYKRPLAKDLPDNIADWYNRKSFAVMHTSPDVDALFSGDLLTQLEQGFVALEPLYLYLMEVEKMKREGGL